MTRAPPTTPSCRVLRRRHGAGRRSGRGSRPRPASISSRSSTRRAISSRSSARLGSLAQGTASFRHRTGTTTLLVVARPGFHGNLPELEVVVPCDAARGRCPTSRPSAPTRRSPMPPSSGWNTSILTKVSSAGSRAIATRSASTTSPPGAPFRRTCSTSCRRPTGYAKAVFPRLEDEGQLRGGFKAGWDGVVGANVVQ